MLFISSNGPKADLDYYKYYAGITSQIGFCSTPLRLDSYNRCQFGCGYCYASTRQGFGRDSRFQASNSTSLRKRFDRVFAGQIASALDEFIQKRIPFQLGGMSDPFSKIEEKSQVTLEYLRILKEYEYPVIISTKSDLIANDEYLDALSNSNSYVRFSTTVVDEAYRAQVDQGCPAIDKVASAARALVCINIPVSFRLQPILPGHESFAMELIHLASEVGVKHISAEYLKVSIDSNKKYGSGLKELYAGDLALAYSSYGAVRTGQEYALPLSYRKRHLINMAIAARSGNMTFGFADNDLLLHSDGNSCCNAANLYLRNANYFTGNIFSIAKRRKAGEKLYFVDYLSSWIPTKSISTYLNSKSRLAAFRDDIPDWLRYLANMWRGTYGLYAPNFFDGIESTSEQDLYGFPVFIRNPSDFENLYAAVLREH